VRHNDDRVVAIEADGLRQPMRMIGEAEPTTAARDIHARRIDLDHVRMFSQAAGQFGEVAVDARPAAGNEKDVRFR
jgi:hypothetical protein